MVYYLFNAKLKIKVKNSIHTKVFTLCDLFTWRMHSFLYTVFVDLIVKRTQCHIHAHSYAMNQSIYTICIQHHRHHHHHRRRPKSLCMNHQCNYYILSKIEWMVAILWIFPFIRMDMPERESKWEGKSDSVQHVVNELKVFLWQNAH